MYPVGGTDMDVNSMLRVTLASDSHDARVRVAHFEQMRRESLEFRPARAPGRAVGGGLRQAWAPATRAAAQDRRGSAGAELRTLGDTPSHTIFPDVRSGTSRATGRWRRRGPVLGREAFQPRATRDGGRVRASRPVARVLGSRNGVPRSSRCSIGSHGCSNAVSSYRRSRRRCSQTETCRMTRNCIFSNYLPSA